MLSIFPILSGKITGRMSSVPELRLHESLVFKKFSPKENLETPDESCEVQSTPA